MQDLTIKRTSQSTADVDPIVLREKETVRLVFMPQLVENINKPEACIKGVFAYQRKNKNQAWEDAKSINLSQLKQGEGVAISLSSEELLELLVSLRPLWKNKQEHGLPKTKRSILTLRADLAEKIKEDPDEFIHLLEQISEGADIQIINTLIKWILRSDNRQSTIQAISSTTPESLKYLNAALGVESIKRAIETWERNKNESSEEFWQTYFLSNTFFLSLIFHYPVLLIKDKAYIGGKSIDNQSGKLVDFLLENEITQNATIIEIKAPETPLIGGKYRGVYNVSTELSGSIIQIADYFSSLKENAHSLNHNSERKVHPIRPQKVLLVGNAERQLKDSEKMKAFELFRSSLSDISVVTYDELFLKSKNLINMLETSRQLEPIGLG